MNLSERINDVVKAADYLKSNKSLQCSQFNDLEGYSLKWVFNVKCFSNSNMSQASEQKICTRIL